MLTSDFYGKVDENAIKMLNKNFNNLVQQFSTWGTRTPRGT